MQARLTTHAPRISGAFDMPHDCTTEDRRRRRDSAASEANNFNPLKSPGYEGGLIGNVRTSGYVKLAVTLDIDETVDVVYRVSNCRFETANMASAASCRSMAALLLNRPIVATDAAQRPTG